MSNVSSKEYSWNSAKNLEDDVYYGDLNSNDDRSVMNQSLQVSGSLLNFNTVFPNEVFESSSSNEEMSFINGLGISERKLNPTIWQKFQYLLSVLKDIQNNIIEIDSIIANEHCLKFAKRNQNNLEENGLNSTVNFNFNKDSTKENESKTDEAKLSDIITLLGRISTTLSSFEKYHSTEGKETLKLNENYNVKTNTFEKSDQGCSSTPVEREHLRKTFQPEQFRSSNLKHSQLTFSEIETTNIYPSTLLELDSQQHSLSSESFSGSPDGELEKLSKDIVVGDRISSNQESQEGRNRRNYGQYFDSNDMEHYNTQLNSSSSKNFNDAFIVDLQKDEVELEGLRESGLSSEFNSLSESINDILEENVLLRSLINAMLLIKQTQEKGFDGTLLKPNGKESNNVGIETAEKKWAFKNYEQASMTDSNGQFKKVIPRDTKKARYLAYQLKKDNVLLKENCLKLEAIVMELWRMNRKSRLKFMHEIQSLQKKNKLLSNQLQNFSANSSDCKESEKKKNVSASYISSLSTSSRDAKRKDAQHMQKYHMGNEMPRKKLTSGNKQVEVPKDINSHKLSKSSENVTSNLGNIPHSSLSSSLPVLCRNLQGNSSIQDRTNNSSNFTLLNSSIDIQNSHSKSTSNQSWMDDLPTSLNASTSELNQEDISKEVYRLKSRLKLLEGRCGNGHGDSELSSKAEFATDSRRLLCEMMEITRELFSIFDDQRKAINCLKDEREALLERERVSIDSLLANEKVRKMDSVLKILSMNEKLQEECKTLQEEGERARKEALILEHERDQILREKQDLNMVFTSTLAKIDSENQKLQETLKKIEDKSTGQNISKDNFGQANAIEAQHTPNDFVDQKRPNKDSGRGVESHEIILKETQFDPSTKVDKGGQETQREFDVLLPDTCKPLDNCSNMYTNGGSHIDAANFHSIKDPLKTSKLKGIVLPNPDSNDQLDDIVSNIPLNASQSDSRFSKIDVSESEFPGVLPRICKPMDSCSNMNTEGAFLIDETDFLGNRETLKASKLDRIDGFERSDFNGKPEYISNSPVDAVRSDSRFSEVDDSLTLPDSTVLLEKKHGIDSRTISKSSAEEENLRTIKGKEREYLTQDVSIQAGLLSGDFKDDFHSNWQQSVLWLQRCIVEEKLHSELLCAAQRENSSRVALLEQRVSQKGSKYQSLLGKYKKLQRNLIASKVENSKGKKTLKVCGDTIKKYHNAASAVEDNYRMMLSSLGYSIGVAVDILASHLYLSPIQVHPSPEFSVDPSFWFASQCSRLRWLQYQLRQFGLKSWKEPKEWDYNDQNSNLYSSLSKLSTENENTNLFEKTMSTDSFKGPVNVGTPMKGKSNSNVHHRENEKSTNPFQEEHSENQFLFDRSGYKSLKADGNVSIPLNRLQLEPVVDVSESDLHLSNERTRLERLKADHLSRLLEVLRDIDSRSTIRTTGLQTDSDNAEFLSDPSAVEDSSFVENHESHSESSSFYV